MYEINVYRETLAQRRKAHQQRSRSLLLRALYLTVLVLLIGVFTFQLLLLRQNISAKEVEMGKIEETLARYVPEERVLSAEKLYLLARVKGGKIKWAEKLELLCSLLPAEMWIKQTSLTTVVIDGIKREVFLVVGSTTLQEEHEGLGTILEFLAVLRNDEDFARGFKNISLLSSKRSMTLEKKELSFEFICQIR